MLLAIIGNIARGAGWLGQQTFAEIDPDGFAVYPGPRFKFTHFHH